MESVILFDGILFDPVEIIALFSFHEELREESPLYEKAVNWTKQYGDPITVWVGHRPFVVVSSKESFKEIAGPLRNLVAGRNPTEMGRMLSRGFEVRRQYRAVSPRFLESDQRSYA